MPTIDLGRIKPIWQGQWAGSTAYVKDDIVRHGVDSYICVAAHTSHASTFSNDSANWNLMAQGSDLPSQSGQSGKVLVTDGSALSWGDSGLKASGGFSAGQNVFTHSDNTHVDTSAQSLTNLLTWNNLGTLTKNMTCLLTVQVPTDEAHWSQTSMKLYGSSNNGSSYFDFSNVTFENMAHFAPPSHDTNNHNVFRTWNVHVDYTAGQQPAFKLMGCRNGGSNNLRVNMGSGTAGAGYTYWKAIFTER